MICFLCEDTVHQTVNHKGNVNFGKFSVQILLTHRVIATLLLNGRCLLRRLAIQRTEDAGTMVLPREERIN